MPATRAVKSLLAFAMSALLFLTTRSASAQPKEILLPFTFNEASKGEVPALLEGGDVFLAVRDLELAGVTGSMWRRMLAFARLVSGAHREVNGAEFISLRALAPFLSFKFDEATVSVSVTAVPELLAETRLNVRVEAPAGVVYSRDRSTFLNYSLTSQFGGHPSFFGETGTSIGGNLLLNTFSRSQSHFVRLSSSYAIDQRQQLRRWTVGDASPSTDLLGGSALIGGVTVARNFNLDPYFVRYPPLDLRGTALTPSRVEVYVNGALVSQQDVPPGPFELHNIPVASGAGNTRIVVRDVFGREQEASRPYYYSTGVLQKGLSEFTYSAGFLREGFGSKSFGYRSPALLAFHRRGFTDALTAGGRLEASRNLISGGPAVNWRTRLGEVDVSLAASSDHGRGGGAASLGYQYLARYFSFGGFARSFSREYANVSMRRQADRPLRDTNVFITLLTVRANFSLLWNKANMRDQASSNRVTLLGNLPLTRRASLLASLGSADEGKGRKPEVFVGLSYFFGGSTTGSVSATHRKGRTEAVTEVNRALPLGTGFGYRLQSAMASGGNHSGSGVLQYQSGFGRYEMSFDPYHSNVRPTITAAGGLVYEAGSLLPTRPVQDSFALVRVPGVKDVRVYLSNNVVGRTDSKGDLLVPNLLSYYANRLRIDDRDIPFSYDIQDVEKIIAPPNRGGALVQFPIRQVHMVTGAVTVREAKGDVVPVFGQLTLTLNGQKYESPLGRGGEFYFENLAAGTYDALVDYRGSCRFRLEIAAATEPVVKLPRLFCTPEATRP